MFCLQNLFLHDETVTTVLLLNPFKFVIFSMQFVDKLSRLKQHIYNCSPCQDNPSGNNVYSFEK